MNPHQLSIFFYISGLFLITFGIMFPDSGLASGGVLIMLIAYIVSKIYDKHILKKPIGV